MIIEKEKVVLAYSGGLDTSIILKWLQEERGYEVITFTADIGQNEDLKFVKDKALSMGVKEENIFIEDLRDEFIKDYVFPMFRCNAVYEGVYLLGTAIARPLIAKKQIEIAQKKGAKFVCHGATGKGNDQIRFELGYYALQPTINIVAPWREWDIKSRGDLLSYANKHNIQVSPDKLVEPPYSMDANLLHISYEGNALEDPWVEYDREMFRNIVTPENAPDKKEVIEIEFENGDPVAINSERLSRVELFESLNIIAGRNGVGILDVVENRFIGMKSRGVYETPGGSLLLVAHRAMESITLDKNAAHLKDEMMPKYAEMIYNGFWFSQEREMLQAMINASQSVVNGVVKISLYKGNVEVIGRKSDNSIYREDVVTFENDEGAYDQKDAEGFIKLNALRLRIEDNYK